MGVSDGNLSKKDVRVVLKNLKHAGAHSAKPNHSNRDLIFNGRVALFGGFLRR
jgi:hypothetical protein